MLKRSIMWTIVTSVTLVPAMAAYSFLHRSAGDLSFWDRYAFFAIALLPGVFFCSLLNDSLIILLNKRKS